MKPVHTILMAIGLLLASQAIQAQAVETVYTRFRVIMRSGKEYKGNDGVLKGDSLIGKTAKGEHLAVFRNDILSLEKYKGNKAGTGALLGAGAGCLTAVLALIMAEAEASSDQTVEVNYDAVPPMFAVLTAGGALVGAVIGAANKTWEPVPAGRVHTGLSLDKGRIVLTLAF